MVQYDGRLLIGRDSQTKSAIGNGYRLSGGRDKPTGGQYRRTCFIDGAKRIITGYLQRSYRFLGETGYDATSKKKGKNMLDAHKLYDIGEVKKPVNIAKPCVTFVAQGFLENKLRTTLI
jgi:hypothetical protein